MMKYLFTIILIATISCKDVKAAPDESEGKNKNDKEILFNEDELQQIGNLYQPEKMIIKENRVGENAEKEDYQITLTNSDLLDSDLENLKIHSKKISLLYHNYLKRTLKQFSFDKIIIKVEHRNGKSENYEFTEQDFK